MTNEHFRLENYRHGEVPEQLFKEIRFRSDKPQDCINRILQVMMLIIAQESVWPSEDEWQRLLPQWLLSSFKQYTDLEIQEIMADRSRWAKIEWPFDSWLDRMKDRCWHWWSVAQDKESDPLTIYVAVDGYPCSTAALEHLIEAAGGHSITSQ